jgi:DNA gyrase inhibitor
MKIISAEIENVEPIQTVSIKHIGDYSGIYGAFEELGIWASENDLWVKGPRMAGVYHDDPMCVPTEQLHSRACLEEIVGVELAEGMERYTISGGRYFVMTVVVKMTEYGEAWQKARIAFNEKGCEFDVRDNYELYVSCEDSTQGDDAPWIVRLCIPLK